MRRVGLSVSRRARRPGRISSRETPSRPVVPRGVGQEWRLSACRLETSGPVIGCEVDGCRLLAYGQGVSLRHEGARSVLVSMVAQWCDVLASHLLSIRVGTIPDDVPSR